MPFRKSPQTKINTTTITTITTITLKNKYLQIIELRLEKSSKNSKTLK